MEKQNLRSKKKKIAGILLLLAILGSGSALLFWVEYPIEEVIIEVDFGQVEPFTIKPVWNTLNIWDISFLNGSNSEYNITRFKSRNFFCDHVILLTATGGRSSGTNEMYNEDSFGNPVYNFNALLMALDWVVAVNITATIVIGNTPLKMCTDNPIDYGAFDANIGVPSNYTKYYDYIANLTQAVKNHLGIEISRFDWRIMTEPDNHDWLRNKLDDYFLIYLNSVRAIKSVLPNATISLGNMVKEAPKESVVPFLKKLQNEAPDTLPNQVSYSGYAGGQFDHDERSIGKSGKEWNEALKKDLNLPNLKVNIDEGQILSDFEGIRLWNGDGTEFGAAWNAGVFHQCIINNIGRYTQWDFYMGETSSPSLNVIRMYERIEGETMVKTNVIYPWYARYSQTRLNAFATLSQATGKLHLMIYFTDENHFSNKTMKVNVQLKNVAQNVSMSNPLMFVVNRTYSNGFWHQYELFGHIERGYWEGKTSKWDLNVGVTLNGTGYRDAFYLWTWEHRDDFKLQTATSPQFIEKEGVYQTQMVFPANSVHLWELSA
jgi:hypothetical protein